MLIAKLALAQRLHGRGLRADRLISVLEVVADAAERAGGRCVVVDAIDEVAAAVYRHRGFRAVPNTSRLVMRVADILATFEHARGLPDAADAFAEPE